MKNNFLKSVCLWVFIVSGISAQQLKADVIVHDANPGYIWNNQNFFLDVDNNGVNDYELAIATSGSTVTPPYQITITVNITGLNNNEVETDGNGKAIALNDGATVGNNSFETSAAIFQSYSTGYYFSVNSRKFLGLRFKISGNDHYGFFEVEPQSYEFHMYRYGYETTSNQNITAGASPTAINSPSLVDDFKVMIKNGRIEINSSVLPDRLELTDINGKAIRKNIQQELSIDITGLPRQVYFLTAYEQQSTQPLTVRKLILVE